MAQRFGLLPLVLLVLLFAAARAQHAFRLYASVDDGNDDAACGALDTPCRSISFILENATDPIGQYSIFLYPGVYGGSKNTHLSVDGIGGITINNVRNSPDWPMTSSVAADDADGPVVIDCTVLQGDQGDLACFETSVRFSVHNVTFIGAMSTPLLRMYPGGFTSEFANSVFAVTLGDEPNPGNAPYVAILEGFGGTGARIVVTKCVVTGANLPLVLLYDRQALDITGLHASDCHGQGDKPFIDVAEGSQGLHTVGLQDATFVDISGFTSIYKYSPTADRGTVVANDVTIQNCVVSGSLVDLVGAALLADTLVFRNNSGEVSLGMKRHPLKPDRTVEASWVSGQITSSPTVSISSGAGWIRDVSYGCEKDATCYVPAISIIDPIHLTFNEAILEGFERDDLVALSSTNSIIDVRTTDGAEDSWLWVNGFEISANNGYPGITVSAGDESTLEFNLTNSRISENVNSGGNGGGLSISAAAKSDVVVQVEDTLIVSNRAQLGGGVFCEEENDGNVELRLIGGALVVEGNKAASKGNDLYANSCSIVCDDSTEHICDHVDGGMYTARSSSFGKEPVNWFLTGTVIASLIVLGIAATGSALFLAYLYLHEMHGFEL